MSIVLSAHVTVTTAGTAVSLTTGNFGPGTYQVKFLSGNTGSVFIGNDGADDVTSSNGMELASAVESIVITCTDPSEYYMDAANDGDGVAILRVLGEGQGVAPPAA